MPIYEYECQACGHRLEKIQKMSDERLKDCPECGEPSLNKLVSAPAFRLKGDGWYETDFKTGSKKNALHTSDTSGPLTSTGDSSSSSESSSSKSDKSSGTSGDSAPAKKETKSSASDS